MRQPGEPSIEEILESIKRVIAREDRAALPNGPSLPGEADDEAALERGVADQVTQPAPLVADTVSSSMRSSFEALADASAKAGPQTPASTEGSALETLLRELLKPALADWLDRNLPAIVERMVAAEIARIAGRRG
jgi:cell pole-organizing protein PopZ